MRDFNTQRDIKIETERAGILLANEKTGQSMVLINLELKEAMSQLPLNKKQNKKTLKRNLIPYFNRVKSFTVAVCV